MDGRNGLRNADRTYPGCLGRMANLFEMNIGVSSNRRLTNEPHLDGSLSRRSSDLSSMHPSGELVERKTKSEFKKVSPIAKSNKIPMKMLIDEEMSKEMNARCNEPNLVAKLMGLDALPRVEPDSSGQRNHARGHRSCSDIPISCWEQQNGLFADVDPTAYKDACRETLDGKKMSLVRQKFAEAKRLATDVELRQSQQFQDVLEVLNCNKDIFLKCLQEPNSVFSEHLNSSPGLPPPPETRRITVLRPFKIADDNFAIPGNKYGTQTRKGNCLHQNLEKIQAGSSCPAKYYEDPTQPTRIVVLKPSPGRSPDGKAIVSPQCEQVRELHGEVPLGNVADAEDLESREVAIAIAEKMHACLDRIQGDGTLISSVFSNAFQTDSELMSPESRHSWDYVNRLGSPCYSPSFGRVSYSPDSSVCREAKKRLSERWATVVSDEICQEQRLVPRTSKSLGEMLALSELKMAASPSEEGDPSQEQKDSPSLVMQKEDMNDTPGNLMRSEYVPASSPELETRVSLAAPVVDNGLPELGKEDSTTKGFKSSFKGTLSSFFFLRNRKSHIGSVCASVSKDQFPSFTGEIHRTATHSDKELDQALPVMQELSGEASFATLIAKNGVLPPESGLSVAKSPASKSSGDNLDQPSPVSVLDPPFGDDERLPRGFLYYAKHNEHAAELPVDSTGANLIDKSPTIGFIPRTISWDDTCEDAASSHPPADCLIQGSAAEQDWVLFAKTLLSISGLEGGDVSSNSPLERWHSPESPLDPSLRDIYVKVNDRETMHEAKRRQKRSTRKLVYDCVNTALFEIAGSGLESNPKTIPCTMERSCIPRNALSTPADEVWSLLNLWFSNEARCPSDEDGDESNMESEMVARDDVMGKVWMNHFTMEMDFMRKEIAGMLLEDLVREAVAELAA